MNTNYVDIRDYRLALIDQGKLAATWEDSPGRLVYDLCNEIHRLRNEIDHWRNECDCLRFRLRKEELAPDNEWLTVCCNCMCCWSIGKNEAHYIDCHANPMG